MVTFKTRVVIVAILVVVAIVAFNTISIAQSSDLGDKLTEFTIDKISTDTYDKCSKEWSNNGWFKAKDNSSISFYDKAIVIVSSIESPKPTVVIYFMDSYTEVSEDKAYWYTFESATEYRKITLLKNTEGHPQVIINTLDGNVVYLSISLP